MSIDPNNRWLPPSPHKEKVLEFLERGRAHIEERGHKLSPLLVFEDGGVMELPLARYNNGNFSPASGVTATRQTNYYDICGTIDELKKLLKEKPKMAEYNPSRFFELIDDVCYMLSRMQTRQEKYKQFAEAVIKIAQKLEQIKVPDINYALRKSEKLSNFILEQPGNVEEKLEQLYETAEEIRHVANCMEKDVLYTYRDLSKELGQIYAEVKGSRKWD